MDPEVQILPRTFEANQHPKGSQERARLNEDALTSEYYPSHKYLLRIQALMKDGTPNPVQKWHDYTYRTKRQAQAELASGRWTSEFSHQALKPVLDFVSQLQDPAEIAARQIQRPEGEPHPQCRPTCGATLHSAMYWATLTYEPNPYIQRQACRTYCHDLHFEWSTILYHLDGQ